MNELFLIIFNWIWLAPVIVTVIGGASALWSRSRQSIIHVCVLVCLLAALPAFIYLWGTFDPIAAGEPTNAFAAAFYLVVMVLSGLAYTILALALYFKRRRITATLDGQLRGD